MIKPNLKTTDKILSLSHNDPDGMGCQIALNHIFKNIHFNNVSFYKIDNVLKNVNYNDFDWVFLTDLHPTDESILDISPKIIMIDHHKSAQGMHNPSKFRYVIQGKCGAILTKNFLESIFNVKLSKLNSLFYLINDYDMYTLKNPKSKLLYDLMYNYHKPISARENFYSGRTRFLPKEITWLKERREEFNKNFEELTVYNIESIDGCVITQTEHMNEIATRLMNMKYKIVFVRNPTTERVSIRHKIDWFNCGEFLSERNWGGGHDKAAGFFAENDDDFLNKVSQIESYILNHEV